MFAVIGQKIFQKLCDNLPFRVANGETIGNELVENTHFNTTEDWFVYGTPPRYYSVNNNKLFFWSTSATSDAGAFTTISIVSGKKYIIEAEGFSPFTTSWSVGGSPGSGTVYQSNVIPEGNFKVSLPFTSNLTGYAFLDIFADSNNTAQSYLSKISVREVSTSCKVTPVIIPQGTTYPATTYEISNVSNFMSKGGSLNSCDVSINISCFADGYATTYNQAKAVVEALDLYQVTYSEDGQSYTAKFRFMNLDDEYYKQPEKFYKNLTFNCLIIKN